MKQSNQVFKILMFPVGSLNLAFSINFVRKVIKYTPVIGSGLNHFGVANIDNREITVVDLYKRLFKNSSKFSNSETGYLILAKNSAGESFGVRVEQAPSLIDLPGDKIRALPESYRRADTLSISTHVAIIDHHQEKLTIFLVNTDELVPPIAASTR